MEHTAGVPLPMETLKLMTCGQKDDCGDWVEGEGSRKHPGATSRVTTMWDEEVNKDHKLTFFFFFSNPFRAWVSSPAF